MSDMGVIAKEDLAWVEEEWLGKWLNCSLKEVCVVEPMQVFGKLLLKKIITREAMKKHDMKFFLDFNKAWGYLN